MMQHGSKFCCKHTKDKFTQTPHSAPNAALSTAAPSFPRGRCWFPLAFRGALLLGALLSNYRITYSVEM